MNKVTISCGFKLTPKIIDIANCITSRYYKGFSNYNPENAVLEMVEDMGEIRIRKLTPTECYKLMGFSAEDCKKASDAGVSNSQLYKQAGNSIVVNVLEAIFTSLGETYEEFRSVS